MYEYIKRSFDIFASVLALIVLAPVFLLTIIGIEVSDPGPVFYRARRIGYAGNEFVMYKFRSMRVPRNESEQSEASFKADESRIYSFGALIRKLKIDELPQLINIVNGSMSFVGPRPASVDQVAIMREGKYKIADTVRPGLTGPAALYDYIYGDSVAGLADYTKLVLPTRKELEAYYPLHMSLGFDFKMIVWTFICILFSIVKKRPKKIYQELVGWVEKTEETINV